MTKISKSLLCLALISLTAGITLHAADTITKPTTQPTTNSDDRAGEGKFVIGPDYKPDPDVKPKEGVPKGEVIKFTMDSKDSKIFPGIHGPYKRNCSLYIPDGYKKGSGVPLPVIIVQDGDWYGGDVINSLDNLINQKHVPAMAALILHNGGGDYKGSERGLEYDTISGKYSDFVEAEVIPMVEKTYNVKFTTDPDGRATLGGSSGGVAAMNMAWFHPERYHRVLMYSGTMVNHQNGPTEIAPHGGWEYPEHFIAKEEAKPLRVWFEVSENDMGAHDSEASMNNWIISNERVAALFKEKGYHYQFVYAKNAGHTDGKVTKQTLPTALEWLWKGYTPTGK